MTPDQPDTMGTTDNVPSLPPVRADTPPGMDPVKWASMNRAERRAFTRGRQR